MSRSKRRYIDNAPGVVGLWTGEAVFALVAVISGILVYSFYSNYIAAVIVVPIFVILGLLPPLVFGKSLEVRCYLFSVGLCVLLASLGYSLSQVSSDPEDFYYLSAAGDISQNISSLAKVVNAPLAVLIWRYVYAACEYMGIPLAPVIGTTFNAILVGGSGAFTMAAVRRIYPGDRRVHNFALYAFALCGMPLLFGSLHLRDCFVLFVTSLVIFVWVRALMSPQIRYTWVALLVSIMMTFVMYYLRVESIFGIVLICATGSIFRIGRQFGWLFSLLIALVPVFIVSIMLREQLIELLHFALYRKEQYAMSSLLYGSQGSLGYHYIINQIMPVRLVLGACYMLYFPIPIWAGMNGGLYQLLVSWNGLYMLWFTPFLLGSTIVIWRNARIGTWHMNCVMLTAIAYWVNTISVLATSFENRHIGPMASAMVITSCFIVNSRTMHNQQFKLLRVVWLGWAVLINGFWLLIR